MAGTITHSWNGTILTVTSDSGTSSADLKGDTGCRGPQGPAGVAIEGGGGSNADLSAYYTSAQVETRLAATAAGLTTPTQVSQIVTAQTSQFVTEAEVDNKIANADLDLTGYATQAYVATEIAKAQLEGADIDTSQFATKTDIANIATSYATKDYVTQEIANASIGGGGGGNVDLTNYATKTYVDNAIVMNKPNLTNYATKSYVDTTVQTEVNKAITSGMPEVDLTGYATEEYVQTMVQLNQQDLTPYATKTYVDGKYTYSTDDLVAGYSALPTGAVYFVYE